LGNETNSSQVETLINGIAENGTFVLNNDLSNIMEDLKQFILNRVLTKDYTIGSYVKQGEDIVNNVLYTDRENDPEYDKNWKYEHNPEIYETNSGTVEFNNVDLENPVNNFDKTGSYTISQKSQDNPVKEDDAFGEYRLWSDETQKSIYVHQAPLSNLYITPFLNTDKSACVLNIQESAYDPDHQSDVDKGIVEKEYKWKNVLDENWTYGSFPQELPLDNNYIFVLTVKDREGTLSNPSVVMVSTKGLEEEEPPVDDTIPPTVSITLSKSKIVTGQSTIITANMSDNVGISHTIASVNGKPVYLDTKGICIYTADEVGSLVVRVEVYDYAGNMTAAEKTLTVVEDSAPKVTISSLGEVAINQTFTITVSSSDDIGVTKVEAELNGTAVILESNRYTLTPQEVGTLVFKATAYDTIGQKTTAEKVINVTLDTTPPIVTLTSNLYTVAVGQPFTITSKAIDNVGVVSFITEINGEPVTLDENGRYTYIPEATGTINIKAYAIDSSENKGTAERNINVTMDTTAPTVSISSVTSILRYKPFTVTVNAADNVGVTRVEAYMGEIPLILDENNKCIITPENIGTITISAYAYDSENNMGSSTRNITVNPDVTAPVVSISTSPSTSVIEGKPILVTVSASDNVGVKDIVFDANGVIYELDENRKCTIIPQSPGTLTLTANVNDLSDNKGTAQKNITVTADTTAPTVSISSTASTVVVGNPFTITVTANDNVGVTKLEVDFNGVPITLNENNKYTFKTTEIGTILITAKASDRVENETIVTRTINVVADTTKPVISYTATPTSTPLVGQIVGQKVELTIKATDNVAVTLFEVTKDGQPIIMDENNKYSFIPEYTGAISINIKAADAEGNIATLSKTITVKADTIAPQITLTTDVDEINKGESVNIHVEATDNAGVVKVEAFYKDEFITLDESGNATITPDSSGKIYVRAYDLTGNMGTAEKNITVNKPIEPSSGDYEKPVIILEMSSTIANIGEVITIKATATDNIGVETISAKFNGIEITLDEQGIGTFTANAVGFFSVKAEAVDAAGNTGYTEQELFVKGVDDQVQPQALITSPTEGTKLNTPVDIIGTAKDENFVRYILEYSESGEDDFVKLMESTTQVENGTLGKFDTMMLKNGLYDVRLSVFDAGGNILRYTNTYQVDGNMKVGNFSISFSDMLVPVEGIPVSVERTYDNRDKSKGDFGSGWTLGVNDVKLSESCVPGENWNQVASGSGFNLRYNLFETKPHTITVAYPDGSVDEFTMTLTPSSNPLFEIQEATVSFTAKAGTLSKLEALDVSNACIVTDAVDGYWGLYDYDLRYYNPTRYKLTTRDGAVYIINQGTGLESITDANGNKITFGQNGIIHSAGKSINFVRDSENRITQIIDPMGNTIEYTYDYYGDLVSVVDQVGNVTRFLYNNNHDLIDIIDPRGIKVARNEYDESGKLVAHIDSEGNRIEYTHNVSTNQEIVKDRLGNVTIISYDNNGNVLQKTDALGNSTTYTYDSNDNKLSETNALGNTINYTYDSYNNLLTETDALGNKTEYTYNTLGKILTIKDPEGNLTSNSYDTNGNLLSTIDSAGNATSYNYDLHGNLIKLTDTLGNTTEYSYDSSGNVLTEKDSLGNITKYSYDSNGNQLTKTTTRTTSSGTETITEINKFNSIGKITEITDAYGDNSKIEYNSIGKQSVIIDKLGNRTEFEYDIYGNLVKTTYADGAIETFTYDLEGRKLSSTDRLGRTTKYEYDKLGRQIKTIYADNTTESSQYNQVGNLIKQVDPLGNETTYEYDVVGRNTKVTDALGNSTLYEYDNNGKKIKMTDAKGNYTTYQYDLLGNLIKTTFMDGTYISALYNSESQKISETDQAGKTTQFGYDNNGKLIKVTDELGNITKYGYNELGNLTSQIDANGNETKFEYDKLGRRVKRTLPLGMDETFVYNSNSTVKSHTDFNGNITEFVYDTNGRLINKKLQDGSTYTYEYTLSSQLSKVTDSNGVTSYEYDAKDRLIKQTNPDGSTLEYTYDAAGNKLSVKVASGVTLYSYDSLNRLLKVQDPDSGITEYTYDSVGNRSTVKNPDGTTSEYSYDNINRLISLSNKKSDGSIISSYVYTLEPSGNRKKVVESNGRIVDYTYDDTYKLTKENITDSINGNKVIEYTYDGVGNRLTKTEDGTLTNYTYDSNDRLLTEGENTYTYDSNGNTLSKVNSDESVTYSYNLENKLIKAITTSSTGTSTIEYGYDSEGIRNEKIVDGVVSKYLVDKNRDYAQVLEERDSQGNLVVSYIYGDDLISQKRDSVKNYYVYDGHGSVRALTDSNGNVTDNLYI